MAACDACVLLRAPTMGETSGSAIRTLSLGKPLVVSDVGWFAELPDDVALKVPVGGDEEVDALAAALERLADPGVAARMGDAARAYVEREHDLGRVAGLYAAALEEAAGDAVVREGVLREVAAAAADTGVEPELLAPELRAAALVSPDGRAPAGHVPVSDPGTRLPADLADVGSGSRVALRRLGRRPARARPSRRLAVDHGRRARLLRHGAELRARRATS